MSMTFRQLEALRLVLARGTTKHAAEGIGLTQSAVSRLITQLERELGFQLFERRHGRLRVTPEGQLFYEAAEKVLTGMDQIKAMARDISTLTYSSLRIVALPALGFGLLPGALAALRQVYPQARITIDLAPRERVEDGILHGRHDLGEITLPSENVALQAEPLCGADAVCVLPKGHRLAAAAVIEATDLEGEAFISIEPSTLFRFRTDELFGRLGVRRVLQIETQSTIMICSLVAQGLGVSLVHPFIAAAFAERLVIRAFAPAIRFEYGVLWPSGQPLSRIAQEFLELLRQSVRDAPRADE